MRIIDKVMKLLATKKTDMTLKEIYESIPEHSHEAIRGNMYRYLKNNPNPEFKRVGAGIYSVIEVISCRKENGESVIDYSADYYDGESEVHFYHTSVRAEGINPGLYAHVDNFASFEELENHASSIRGIFQTGDAVEVMKRYKDESFNLLLTDPPYRVISGGAGAKGAPKGMLSKNDGKIFAFNDVNLRDWLLESYRLLKNGSQAYVFTNFLNLQNTMKTMEEVGFKLHNLLVWQKNNATPNRWYMKNCEYVVFARKGKAKAINGCGSMTVHQFDNILGNKVHETEKPLDLLRYYIENSTKIGDWILDPFGGSGSTACAAIETGRRFLTMEIDPKYTGAIHERIKQTFNSILADTAMMAS